MTYLINNTPLEAHRAEHGLWVKREDLCCPPPGPPFSKTRGVYLHVKKRVEEGVRLFGVLDTLHSQGGLAVAHACKVLGVDCINYYPQYKADTFGVLRPVQVASRELGARLESLPAGRSAVLYHQAKRQVEAEGGYMMPNALKLSETVDETAAEVTRTLEAFPQLAYYPWLVSASSGTIAAGVTRGLVGAEGWGGTPELIVHMGYERPDMAVRKYIHDQATTQQLNSRRVDLEIIQEGYAYKDVARPGPTPPWACNAHYDLKAYRWWMQEGRARFSTAVMWNIG